MRKLNILPNTGTNNSEIILNKGDLSYYNDNKSYNYNIDTTLITFLESFNAKFTYNSNYDEITMRIEED